MSVLFVLVWTCCIGVIRRGRRATANDLTLEEHLVAEQEAMEVEEEEEEDEEEEEEEDASEPESEDDDRVESTRGRKRKQVGNYFDEDEDLLDAMELKPATTRGPYKTKKKATKKTTSTRPTRGARKKQVDSDDEHEVQNVSAIRKYQLNF